MATWRTAAFGTSALASFFSLGGCHMSTSLWNLDFSESFDNLKQTWMPHVSYNLFLKVIKPQLDEYAILSLCSIVDPHSQLCNHTTMSFCTHFDCYHLIEWGVTSGYYQLHMILYGLERACHTKGQLSSIHMVYNVERSPLEVATSRCSRPLLTIKSNNFINPTRGN